MKKSDKIKLTAIAIFIVTIVFAMINDAKAQSVHGMFGYKSAEIGYTYLDEETELIFGFSVSAVDSKLAESRANRNDKGNIHEFQDQFTPAMFFLIGGKFDEFSIIGKLGGSNVKQNINGIKDEKYVYFATGIMFSYDLSDKISLLGSYDSVTSAMCGVSYRL